VNTHTCKCDAGYDGADCQNDINECIGKDCSNEGTCANNIGFYKCDCNDGRGGADCEIDGGCSTNADGAACENGGIPTGSKVDPIVECACECVVGYTGAACEIDPTTITITTATLTTITKTITTTKTTTVSSTTTTTSTTTPSLKGQFMGVDVDFTEFSCINKLDANGTTDGKTFCHPGGPVISSGNGLDLYDAWTLAVRLLHMNTAQTELLGSVLTVLTGLNPLFSDCNVYGARVF
jgi:hypothetical protein